MTGLSDCQLALPQRAELFNVWHYVYEIKETGRDEVKHQTKKREKSQECKSDTLEQESRCQIQTEVG